MGCLVWYYWIGSGSSGGNTSYQSRYSEPKTWRTGASGSPPQSSWHQRGRFNDDYSGEYMGGGLGGGWDISFMLSAGVLGLFVYNLGGGGTPGGWSASQLMHRVRNMDLWQLMMLTNLVQQ